MKFLRGVAQSVARLLWEQEVRGSSPRTPTDWSTILSFYAWSTMCGSNSVGRVPAFQAGCRGFESRLPLSSVHRLFAGTSNARWEQPGGEEESKQTMFYYAKWRAATSCLAKHARITSREIVPSGRIFPPFFSTHRQSPPSFPVAFGCFLSSSKGWLFLLDEYDFS